MSTKILIHQLYHGYRRGHEQISASIRLNQVDSDVITRLSDLSGTRQSGFTFESYLTIYPLPSSRLFALALTRPDRNAPRAGCVLTHTLLLEMDKWSALPVPEEISALFFKTATVPNEISILEYTPGTSIVEHPQASVVSLEDEDFVAKYFGEGIRPIIWFDALKAETKLWKIVTGLWPSIRRSFSACTLCLQPRFLQARIFDVMFAPGTTTSRFSRLSADHFIESAPLTREPWQIEFADQLFSGKSVDSESKSLITALDADPPSIRKVFLFRELWKRSSEKPTAAIGAFDLLESINASASVTQLQNKALNRAVSSFEFLSSNERLELFSMLLLRISRVRSGGNKQEVFFKNLLAPVMGGILHDFPQEVITSIERMWPNLQGSAGLKDAFMSELEAALIETPSLAAILATSSDIGKDLLAQCTPAFAKALNVPSATLLREQTIAWLNEAPFRELLPKFRVSLLSHLKIDQDLALFRKALIDIQEVEVITVLDLLFGSGLVSYCKQEVRDVIIDLIARPYPTVTREWIEASSHRNGIIADIASVTYPPNATEYREVLKDTGPDLKFQRAVFSNWVVRNSAYSSQYAFDIANLASHDSMILDSLITPDCEEMSEKALEIIVDSLGLVLPISEPLVRKIFLYRADNLKLVDIAIRSAIMDFVGSGSNTTALEAVLEQKQLLEWLEDGQKWRLAHIIRTGISDPESCSRAWKVFFKLLDLAFRGNNLISSLELLIAVTAQFWSPSILEIWVKIIQRARNSHSVKTFDADLCGQAIRFAFENPHLSTSGLVVEGFMSLYKSVTEAYYVPDTATPLFSFWSWDKGRELREAVVEKFVIGNWPPGDLAMAVPDFGLLKKILKRMSRMSGGHSFIRKMYSDLASREDSESHSIAIKITNLLKNTDYEEEWD